MALPTKTDEIQPRVVHTVKLRTGRYRIVKRGGDWVNTYDIEMALTDSLKMESWRPIQSFRLDDARSPSDLHFFIETLFAQVISDHTDTPVLTSLQLDTLANHILVAVGEKKNSALQVQLRELLSQAMRKAYPMRPEA